MDEYAIKVENLNRKFKTSFFKKDKLILNNVSFKIPRNKTTGFVGNNGSGKTTTIKCLLEFIFKNSGEILFFDHPLNSKMRSKIGYLPERPYFYEFLTAKEFLEFHFKLSTPDVISPRSLIVDKVDKALKKVGLSDAKDKYLRSFSKGMLQRIGLAQALIHEPELLILDEPMSGLDPDGRLMVKDILKEEKKKGISLFFSSHLLQDMEELCDFLVVIHQGEIIYNDELKIFMSEYPSLEEAFRSRKKETLK